MTLLYKLTAHLYTNKAGKWVLCGVYNGLLANIPAGFTTNVLLTAPSCPTIFSSCLPILKTSSSQFIVLKSLNEYAKRTKYNHKISRRSNGFAPHHGRQKVPIIWVHERGQRSIYPSVPISPESPFLVTFPNCFKIFFLIYGKSNAPPWVPLPKLPVTYKIWEE